MITLTDPIACTRCRVERHDCVTRAHERVCICCITDELDEVLFMIGLARDKQQISTPGKLLAFEYLDEIVKERDEAREKARRSLVAMRDAERTTLGALGLFTAREKRLLDALRVARGYMGDWRCKCGSKRCDICHVSSVLADTEAPDDK